MEHLPSVTFSKVSVVGMGYIGLPTAALLAHKGVSVVGVDINPRIVEIINRGEIHIVEPELEHLVAQVISAGTLRASSRIEPADAFLIAVPTPTTTGQEPDLSYVEASAEAIALVLQPGNLVIIESSSPVGTTEQVARRMAELRPDLTFPLTHGATSDIRIAYCPERALPGHLLEEITHNDRIIGGLTARCAHYAQALYQRFVENDCFLTDARTAEMCKLTENSFRDVNIAFANELSMICEQLGVNVWNLIRLANRHPRVHILQPGPGVGGHCIAVDPWFIVHRNPQEARLIRTAREVNDEKTHWVMEKIRRALRDFLSRHPQKDPLEVSIACFGLSFKANIDDLRESPALEIVHDILRWHSGPVWVVEPYLSRLPDSLPDSVQLKPAAEAFQNANLRVLLVDHELFQSLGPATGEFLDFKGLWTC